MTTAELIFTALAVWLAVGILVAVPFVFLGAGRILDAARASSLAFRLLVIPGAAALWPLVLCRWLRAKRGDA